ncbi:MAG: hypothetical protein HN403_07465 [Rhodospirillales bacterium]|jgi:hypothetical protein|nr:hypothetical protein [Rhodospirillales bacterium]
MAPEMVKRKERTERKEPSFVELMFDFFIGNLLIVIFGGIVFILIFNLSKWAFDLQNVDGWLGLVFEISCILISVLSALFFGRLLRKLWD